MFVSSDVYIIYVEKKKNIPLFWSHIWKCNIQANEGLTKVKEKWSIVLNLMLCFLSFSLFQCLRLSHKQKWHMLFFTCIKLVVHVLVCACNCMHQMEKTVINSAQISQTQDECNINLLFINYLLILFPSCFCEILALYVSWITWSLILHFLLS